jgi:hypothetical protein
MKNSMQRWQNWQTQMTKCQLGKGLVAHSHTMISQQQSKVSLPGTIRSLRDLADPEQSFRKTAEKLRYA